MLSAGQRQRIVLARVLARNPEILILDEATSALDTDSEYFIKKTIQDLHGSVTIIIIAHRLSTVVEVDRIIVIDKGKIVEEGSTKELLKDENSYFHKKYHLKR
jgi:ABC-type multidrug transport system fused ATPase/permease subunit